LVKKELCLRIAKKGGNKVQIIIPIGCILFNFALKKEKTMKSLKTWMGMLVMALVFGMMVVGCDDGTKDDNDLPSQGGGKLYTEGDIYITDLSAILHYYFSNTPEGIEQAIFDNGIPYLNPPLKNATWALNSTLDNNVKNAMDSRGVSYSCTFSVQNGTVYLMVNKKANGSWYIAIYS